MGLEVLRLFVFLVCVKWECEPRCELFLEAGFQVAQTWPTKFNTQEDTIAKSNLKTKIRPNDESPVNSKTKLLFVMTKRNRVSVAMYIFTNNSLNCEVNRVLTISFWFGIDCYHFFLWIFCLPIWWPELFISYVNVRWVNANQYSIHHIHLTADMYPTLFVPIKICVESAALTHKFKGQNAELLFPCKCLRDTLYE